MVKKVTDLYDDIWSNFDKEMVNEAYLLLKTRLERNKIPLKLLKNKRVLDMGCGSGRYSIALKKMGAKEVIGLDLGDGKKLKYKGITYIKGTTLKLPFADSSFDFVFCNGVLHHTTNPMKGLKEMHRVLKPGCWSWLYVCGEAKFFEMLDDIRKNLNPKDSKKFRKLLELWKLPKQKQFLLTDLLFVPLRHYFKRESLEKTLKNIGFKKIIFLYRGVDNDYSEQTYQNQNLAEYFNKNGEADLRFMLKK